jgi:periplasmic glucans biosynthesis protein
LSPSPLSRRLFLAGAIPWSVAFAARRVPQAGIVYGPARPFGYEWLRARAQAMARTDFKMAERPARDIVQTIDYDVSQRIRYRADCALWGNGPGPFPLRFFPLKQSVPDPVTLNAIDGRDARRILYRPSYFDWGGTGLDGRLPDDLGFSGFRVMNGRSVERDWLAFQGASYFRTSGTDDQYGASARGIAVDTALSTREEFPVFTEFWIAEGGAPDGPVTVYALLDGPSITGAYKIVARRDKGVTMDIHAELFPRGDIARLGIAPLTSMYWYSESNKLQGDDWRPEVHDSDGLALWTGKGERIWRPLVNPPSLQVNSFLDTNPKGFGLMQRDRDFNNYQDDGTFYNKRPSIWVEPRGDWGEGAVQLIEIPTDDETHDNIVAYWLPKKQVGAGATVALDYRLYWQDPEPFAPSVAWVVATRIGRGGIAGDPPEPDTHKFVIDFAGGALSAMQPRYDISPVVTLSRGTVAHGYVIKVVGTDRWRAVLDVKAPGKAPIDMRCFLRLGNNTLSETWLYQYFPPG